MFYKLSNTANLPAIEDAFDAKFKYPHIYKKAQLINGLSEQSLPIITLKDKKQINYAIWGLVPQNYKEGWETFQNLINTLNISIDEMREIEWVGSLLNKQRCIVVVNGFFTNYIYNGEVYPFYVYDKDYKPFALAAVYSELEDGFLSFSLVTSPLENPLKMVHNLGNAFPVALCNTEFEMWLDPKTNFYDKGLEDINKLELNAHSISKEFYKNNIIYDDILKPAYYNSLPILSLK